MLFGLDLRFFAIILAVLVAIIIGSTLWKSGFMRISEDDVGTDRDEDFRK